MASAEYKNLYKFLTGLVVQSKCVEPKVEPKVEPIVEPIVEPKVEPIIERTVEPLIEPKVEPIIELKPDPKVEPSIPRMITTDNEVIHLILESDIIRRKRGRPRKIVENTQQL